IRSLDRWAIAGALTQRCALLERGWQGWVAVNLSPSSVSDPGLPAYVQQVLAESDAEPGSLVLELPEAAVLRDAPAAADFMWELKNAGAAIAIDDFSGTSFRHLQRLPVDVLKLDARFTDGIGAEDGGNGQEGLVEGAIAIARGIRARVLAKGVERESQLRWLSDAGCDYLQGYLTGEPVPADDLRTDPDPRAIHGD
ncbi:MAG TPA: EAL domain-containing protein, partial [Longimicrobiales bacterium]|nr:EAL domain-containing protein [Longimicrobiales bacterium]